MNVHSLFPITVCEFQYPKSTEFKQILSKTIFKHLNENGKSNEMTGHVSIHHDPEYYDLFYFLNNCIEEYLNLLNVHVDHFDINFIKSWFNILKEQSTRNHSHSDAHISISYYANVPKSCEQYLTFNHDNEMEPFTGCTSWNNNGNWSIHNSKSWRFLPKEGDIFIFPAKLFHETEPLNPSELYFNNKAPQSSIKSISDLHEHRITIASDVLLCYKDKQALPLGIQPIENWRSFK
jgi:hypothetical protein